MKAAKFWVALASALASAVLTVVAPDTTAAKVAAAVVALAGAVAVYVVPNSPTPPAGVTGTKVNELGGGK